MSHFFQTYLSTLRITVFKIFNDACHNNQTAQALCSTKNPNLNPNRIKRCSLCDPIYYNDPTYFYDNKLINRDLMREIGYSYKKEAHSSI